MRVTRIEKQKKHPQRVNVYADGEFLIGLSAETLLRHGIRAGDDLGAATLKSLVQTEEHLNAKRIALRYLSHRPRTEREVRDKLREEEFPPHEISATIDDLTRAKLLDDEAFARMFVRDALTLRPSGRLLLKRKMLLAGVARPLVDRVLDDAFAEVDQTDLALTAARKFIRRSGRRTSVTAKTRARVVNYLTRRGYTWDTIQHVLKVILNAGNDDSEVE